MKNKFILMGMDDHRSKKVAEVLGNNTCKKILNYLSENQGKSEQDIAKALGMKINTVEYNLKKLLDSGLIEKTKNFFWSKKGKKIDLYKPARKHIVISPKSTKPSLNSLKTIIPLIIAIVAVLALITLFSQDLQKEQEVIKQFNSFDELKDFIKENKVKGGWVEGLYGAVGSGRQAMDSGPPESTSEYSETNIQVEGVDEADIIKNDGKYIYVVSQNKNKVIILDAYPAENMKILSEITLSNEHNIGEIFLNDDKLIVFANTYAPVFYAEQRCGGVEKCIIPNPQESLTQIYIYDLSDRKNPELQHEISMTGDYVNSRMIDNYIYVVANQYIYGEDNIILPAVRNNEEIDVVEPQEILYPDMKDYGFQFTIVLGVNINNGETTQEVLLTGMSQNIYVSQKNIYTTYTVHPAWYRETFTNEKEKTIINKISINENEINYVATGEVPGHVLNQFSMDEYGGNFRIATTLGEVWNQGPEDASQNNIYVLSKTLEIIGELEGLAPGEKIYSVRFIGEKGYVVTFKKVDPLFVIDLSDPENPDVLGKLKIPGYSDYLHPYDENHIIGIGKETIEADPESQEQRGFGFAWYQGVKMAVFDVTDVENPIELHKVVIGDRGTDSDVLRDHKAFLFDKKKELLVLPINLAEIPEEMKTEDPPHGVPKYGEHTFQGAYVYKITLKDGFELRGRITHYDEDEVEKKSGGYAYYGNKNVKRALYMDDVLYTISNAMVKANDLDNLDEINYVEF